MWMTIVFAGLFASAKAAGDRVKETIPDEQTIPGLDTPLPSPQQLLEMLDSMAGISEEDKANLREELMKNIEGGRVFDVQQIVTNDLTTQTLILLSLLAIVTLIFVFFVYKLFRCLKEREQKKEEKKKSKQSKKKK